MAVLAGRARSRTPGVHRRDLDQDQHGADPGPGAEGPASARIRAPRPLADHDLPRDAALRPTHRALCLRRADQRRQLPRLRRAATRAHPQARRHRHLRSQSEATDRVDNLGSHKSKAVRTAIKTAGARLWFLPPYSPDLNPIEQAFARIKHWMRTAQKRNIEDTWRQLGRITETFTPTECANYLQNAGYASANK